MTAEHLHQLQALSDGLHRLRWRGQVTIVKRRRDAPVDFFAAERRGLELLASADALKTPAVYLCEPGLIALQDLGRGTPERRDWQAAGRRLARQHSLHAERFGLEWNGWCGDSAQSNQPDSDGYRFFAEQRLRPQWRRANASGYLAPGEVDALQRIADRLPDWIPAQPASLLHGDLWLGNLHACASGELALIDGAAAHYGWAEAELAMLCLFGEPPAEFFAAYQEAAGIDAGWRERIPLYNLYHLLNHLNLFGSSYLGALRDVLRRFG